MIKQYCRYCSHLTTGNGIWCEAHQRTYSEKYAKTMNNCSDFELHIVDAFGEEVHKPRPEVDDRQITFEDLEEGLSNGDI